MNFQESIQSGFRHYVSVEGRAPRSEFWFWTLFTVLLYVAAGILDGVISANGQPSHVCYIIVCIGVFLPNICMGVRRLHDIDFRGWWLLIALIPLAGAIALIVMDCLRGTEGNNRFGPNPLTTPEFPTN
jgi:uncharacterized membrane protein YhaH (DUF805 family)